MAGRELTRHGRAQELMPGGFGGTWGIFDQLRREMDRLFDTFPRIGRGVPEVGEFLSASILIDVRETDGQVRLEAELPGVSEGDIELSLDPSGELLVLRGEKKLQREAEEQGVYRAERAYGRFERIVELPAPVKDDPIEAHFKNGVLTVEMTKSDGGRARKKIPIKAS